MEFALQFKQRLLKETIFNFESLALELFNFQAVYNPIYKQYIELLNFKTNKVSSIHQIPYLPINFFKNHSVVTGNFIPQTHFYSSGTTLQKRSVHAVADLDFYLRISVAGFEKQYGSLKDFIVIALLPSYYENESSSLICMVNEFIKATGNQLSRFIHLTDKMYILDAYNQRENKTLLLIGVSYALLEITKDVAIDIPEAMVMETGGMKGMVKEMPRAELHAILKDKFNVTSIHSEYGMTELLSQAYAKSDGQYIPTSTMKVCIREINDPFVINNSLSQGGINVIDLANIESCGFIETEDIGSINESGNFQVLGRLDNAEARGCNLLAIYS